MRCDSCSPVGRGDGCTDAGARPVANATIEPASGDSSTPEPAVPCGSAGGGSDTAASAAVDAPPPPPTAAAASRCADARSALIASGRRGDSGSAATGEVSDAGEPGAEETRSDRELPAGEPAGDCRSARAGRAGCSAAALPEDDAAPLEPADCGADDPAARKPKAASTAASSADRSMAAGAGG